MIETADVVVVGGGVNGVSIAYALAARGVGRVVLCEQAALANGLVWEHYHADWSVDWDYNKDDKTNIFRPWGYQPGHLTEWAKLLLILERHAGRLAAPSDWLLASEATRPASPPRRDA